MSHFKFYIREYIPRFKI